mmetsp:Transcript_26020/g.26231  ORF Transcript_26020/g.26231 Transcript_26020/m.26231 type:complete len:393 (+) Transcript_26020:48-1226(+)
MARHSKSLLLTLVPKYQFESSDIIPSPPLIFDELYAQNISGKKNSQSFLIYDTHQPHEYLESFLINYAKNSNHITREHRVLTKRIELIKMMKNSSHRKPITLCSSSSFSHTLLFKDTDALYPPISPSHRSVSTQTPPCRPLATVSTQTLTQTQPLTLTHSSLESDLYLSQDMYSRTNIIPSHTDERILTPSLSSSPEYPSEAHLPSSAHFFPSTPSPSNISSSYKSSPPLLQTSTSRIESEVFWELDFPDINRIYDSDAFIFAGLRWRLSFGRYNEKGFGMLISLAQQGICANIMCEFRIYAPNLPTYSRKPDYEYYFESDHIIYRGYREFIDAQLLSYVHNGKLNLSVVLGSNDADTSDSLPVPHDSPDKIPDTSVCGKGSYLRRRFSNKF